jgi:hypothetical protein
MLLAFPSDYWDDEHIRGAVKDFGALISWGKELSNYGALIVKVRVVDLHHIPHSCVISSGNEWSAESWSVPIFILSQRLLGALPADEELPPADGSTPHPLHNAVVVINNQPPPNEAQALSRIMLHGPFGNMCNMCSMDPMHPWLTTMVFPQLILQDRIYKSFLVIKAFRLWI